MTDHDGSVTARRPGRPQDPDLEARLFEVVLEMYAETGWAGFHMHKAAARAKVGKAAIYRRWSSKQELLVDALMSLQDRALIPDTGSLRGDLVATVEAELNEYLSPRGLVLLRAQIEAKAFPELLDEPMQRLLRTRSDAGQAIIAAAVGRGELARDVSHTILLDAVGGMTMNHFLASPPHHLRSLRGNPRPFAEAVVDFALRCTDGASL